MFIVKCYSLLDSFVVEISEYDTEWDEPNYLLYREHFRADPGKTPARLELLAEAAQRAAANLRQEQRAGTP